MSVSLPPSLSSATDRVVVQALASQPAGNQVLGSLGALGGFQLGSAGAIAASSGDCVAIPDSGGAPGTYRVIFPNLNAEIQSIAWANVAGFTPRIPTGVETAAALVCGYNQDATTLQWYITVQIVNIQTQAVLSSPPTGFVVGVRAAFIFTPQANKL
jgi:hypothetical protein